MKIFESLERWQEYRKNQVSNELGFIPTMGALHNGHLSLIEKSIAENSETVVSIFVNPTQFNDPKDFKNYPIDVSQDIEKLKTAKVQYLILPTPKDIYPDGYTFKISELEFSKQLCGISRPGHFDGVLTIVMKLLNLTQPQRVYFGEKDFQQLKLIEKMIKAFFMPIEIIHCPTVREETGLAMSSRNKLLTPDQKKVAPLLYEKISSKANKDQIKTSLEQSGFTIDYLEDIDGRRFVAAKLGNVRLIDNVSL